MFFNVFPFPTVLLQFLFLIVAIAVEGIILNRLLPLSRRTSIEYAASINLLTAIVGWFTFFFVLPFLPKPLEEQLISYIFFDRLLTSQLPPLYTVIVFTGLTVFLLAFLLKFVGLKLLQIFLDNVPQEKVSFAEQKAVKQRAWLTGNAKQELFSPQPNQAIAILVANACSYSALLLILVLRFIQIHIYQQM